jgi:hypothetical protein
MPKNGDTADGLPYYIGARTQRPATLLRSVLTAASSGALAGTGHPASAGLLIFGSFIVWLIAPTARVVRRALAQHVAGILGTDYKATDEH